MTGLFSLFFAISCDAPPQATATAAPPAPTPPAGPDETWGCSTSRSIVEHHNARLLLTGARFELTHTNTSQFGGVNTKIQGSWTRESDALVLVPSSGDRRLWQGDGHKFDHDEPTRYCQWDEPITGETRRLPITTDAAGREVVFVRELGTHLTRSTNSWNTACDDVRVDPRPKPGFRCVTPDR